MKNIEIIQENIVNLKVDGIVNAANPTLLGGGGVDGAIHRAAGPQLLAACKLLNGCKTGEAKITEGFNLPARYVIHTVGPIFRGGNHQEAVMLANCYKNSLKLAKAHGLSSIAFPAISCGVYGYPIADAAKIAIDTTLEFLTRHTFEKIYFTLFGDEIFNCYLKYYNTKS